MRTSRSIPFIPWCAGEYAPFAHSFRERDTGDTPGSLSIIVPFSSFVGIFPTNKAEKKNFQDYVSREWRERQRARANIWITMGWQSSCIWIQHLQFWSHYVFVCEWKFCSGMRCSNNNKKKRVKWNIKPVGYSQAGKSSEIKLGKHYVHAYVVCILCYCCVFCSGPLLHFRWKQTIATDRLSAAATSTIITHFRYWRTITELSRPNVCFAT